MDVSLTIIVSMVVAIFTGFATYYFSTRNNKSMVYDIIEKELGEGIQFHNKEKHQVDFIFEIDKHRKECGNNIHETINTMKTSMHKMELRQNSMNMKLNFVSNIMSRIAEKMQVPISPNMIDNIGDDNG